MKKFNFLYVILFITLSIQANTCVDNLLSNNHVYMYLKTTPIGKDLPEPISKEVVQSEMRKVIHNSFDENLKVHNVVVRAKPNATMFIEWWSIYEDICDYPVEILYQYILPDKELYQPVSLNPIADGLNTQTYARIMTGNIHPKHYEETLETVKDFKVSPNSYIRECPEFRKNVDIVPYFKRLSIRKDIEANLSFDVSDGKIINVSTIESNYKNSIIDSALKNYLIDTAITDSNMTVFDCNLKIKFKY